MTPSAKWQTWSVLLGLLIAAPALADREVHFEPHDVQTAFAISKSDDGNQVQYAVRLDANCAPVGKEPVFGYWREYDHHPERVLSFAMLDYQGYGVVSQEIKEHNSHGTLIEISLKALPKRPIDIQVRKGPDGQCVAQTTTLIAGRFAVLSKIFVQLGGFLSVKWIDLGGTDPDTHAPITERLTK